jgi:hypothetical protein
MCTVQAYKVQQPTYTFILIISHTWDFLEDFLDIWISRTWMILNAVPLGYKVVCGPCVMNEWMNGIEQPRLGHGRM